jgi:hypothetical protein
MPFVARGQDLLGERQALDPALEQGVDEDDVRAELLDLREDLAAVAQDVEELDGALGVQEAADVLRHLRNVLDEEEARLVTGCHRGRVYQARPRWHQARKSQSPLRRSRQARAGSGRRAIRTARSLPGPIGSRS